VLHFKVRMFFKCFIFDFAFIVNIGSHSSIPGKRNIFYLYSIESTGLGTRDYGRRDPPR
jgi:hypothetical protein